MKFKALKTHSNKTEFAPPSIVSTTAAGEKSVDALTRDRSCHKSSKKEVAAGATNNHPREGAKSVEDARYKCTFTQFPFDPNTRRRCAVLPSVLAQLRCLPSCIPVLHSFVFGFKRKKYRINEQENRK